MKLVTFSCRGRLSIGKIVDGQVVDLAAADPALPATMRALLAGGPALLARARAVDAAGAPVFPLAGVRLEAPIPDPGKFLAIGMNCRKLRIRDPSPRWFYPGSSAEGRANDRPQALLARAARPATTRQTLMPRTARSSHHGPSGRIQGSVVRGSEGRSRWPRAALG